MAPSIRLVFAAVLWLAALTPPVLIVVSMQSPVAAVEFADGAQVALKWIGILTAAVLLLCVLLYPPFLPGMRLWLSRLRARLGTDLGPLREAQNRLQHLDTAADHFTAGRALLQHGESRSALGHLTKAVELDPDHLGSRLFLGRALAAEGDLPAAVEQMKAVVERDPGHAYGAAMLELGELLERGGADEAAARVLAEHHRRFGPQRRASFHRAKALQRLGRRDEALAELREAAAPPPPDTRITLDDALIRAKARVALWKVR